MTDAEALGRVRYEAMVACAVYPGGPVALAHQQKVIARALATIEAGAAGGLVKDRDDADVSAFVLWWREPFLPGGPEVTNLLAFRRPGTDPGGLLRALDTLLPDLDDTVLAILPAWDRAARAHLLDAGLGISGVNLTGRVDEALRRLMATRDPPRQPGGGLALVPLEAGQIEAALAIRRDYFAAHPAFCWFAADPGSVAHLRRKLAAPRPRDRHLAVVAGERVVGCASVFVFDPDPHHGRSGGLDIVLHPDIQGRGVGTVIYRVLLEYLEAEGIGWVKGTTGQPSVMHLARLMGRQPTSVMLRRSPVLPSAWFDEVLP